MSRSKRHTPIMGHSCAESEKKDKILWHKKWRRKERQNIQKTKKGDLEGHRTILFTEVSDPWSMDKDGKSYFPPEKQVKRAKEFLDGLHKNVRFGGGKRYHFTDAYKRIIHKWMGK
jgi:hypothetical protein